MEFTEYTVGKQVCAPIKGDAAIFEIDPSGAMLALKFQKPNSKEKNNIKSGVAQFKAVSIDGIVFFLARFGASPWIDAPYNKTYTRGTIPTPKEGNGLSLHVMLVDASTGILVAQRLIGLGTQFTRDLAAMVELQPDFPDLEAYQDKINHIYARYSTQDMVDMGGTRN